MTRKIGSIGDVNPIKYGGGLIFTAPGSGGPWIEYFDGLKTVAPDVDEDENLDLEVTIYRVDLHEDAKRFLSWYDWVDWNDVAGSTGRDVEDYISPSNLRTAQARALVIQDAAGYYGWHEFDQDPLQLTLGKLKQRWDEEYEVYSEEMEPTGLGESINQFWDIFEEELGQSVAKNPADYALNPGEAPEDYARRTRIKMQGAAEAFSISRINLDSPTFRRVARRLGITKFSQRALKEAYAACGGK